jgi:hypothetical protein
MVKMYVQLWGLMLAAVAPLVLVALLTAFAG